MMIPYIFLFLLTCKESYIPCTILNYRVVELRNKITNLDEQMKLINQARDNGEIGKKKYRLFHNEIRKFKLKANYDLEKIYTRLANNECKK